MKHTNILYKSIASVFYIGYIPTAPGTMGSLAALLLYYPIKENPVLTGLCISAVTLIGFMTAGKAETLLGGKDPGKIVIDEFAGMLISLYLLPASPGYIISAFLLFRFFDIVKPFPIRKLENLPGSKGIMLDDITAGVYTNLILQIFNMLF
jgi:phosphatidylglycerophosphatase A